MGGGNARVHKRRRRGAVRYADHLAVLRQDRKLGRLCYPRSRSVYYNVHRCGGHRAVADCAGGTESRRKPPHGPRSARACGRPGRRYSAQFRGNRTGLVLGDRPARSDNLYFTKGGAGARKNNRRSLWPAPERDCRSDAGHGRCRTHHRLSSFGALCLPRCRSPRSDRRR